MSAWKRLAGLLGGLCRARGLSCQVIKQWGGWISLQCSLLKGLVRTTGLSFIGCRRKWPHSPGIGTCAGSCHSHGPSLHSSQSAPGPLSGNPAMLASAVCFQAPQCLEAVWGCDLQAWLDLVRQLSSGLLQAQGAATAR